MIYYTTNRNKAKKIVKCTNFIKNKAFYLLKMTEKLRKK